MLLSAEVPGEADVAPLTGCFSSSDCKWENVEFSGRQTHFGAFQFKISAFGVAHSLLGSRSPNHHSIFGGDKAISIPISPNIGETCVCVPNGLVSSTILLTVAVLNWTRIHTEKDLKQ